MPFPAVQDIVQVDLFTSEDELRTKYPTTSVDRVLRLRAMYNWFISNPDSKDKEFVDECISRYGISKTLAYDDLKIIKSVLPHITQASRDYHRWKYNEMILETYQMAKKRKDTKTMERAATSYAKFNNVNVEEEHIYLDPRISFQEIDRYFLSGCACAFFQVATFAAVLKSTFSLTYVTMRKSGSNYLNFPLKLVILFRLTLFSYSVHFSS